MHEDLRRGVSFASTVVLAVMSLGAASAEKTRFMQGNEQGANSRDVQDDKPRKDKDPETKFTGKLKEFDEEFSALLKAQTDQDQKIRDAGKAIDALKKAAALSTNTPGLGTKFEGDVLEKKAKVKFDNKDYTVTLKLYALVNTEHNIRPMTRWIITDIQE